MPVDLHTHSVVSDGSESPSEVIRSAVAARLNAVALTDHDILEGLTEATQAAAEHDIELIPGIELSLDWSDLVSDSESRGGMHMLVLWIEDGPGPLQDLLADLRLGRDDRNQIILERLAQLGVEVPMDEVAARAGSGSVGRPHIAGVMVERGYVPDITAAFDRYLGNGAPAYVGRRRLKPAEAISAGLASGGVPVLAHPHTLAFEDDGELEAVIRHLADLGLRGLESHHSAIEPARRRFLLKMAERNDLVPSGGSDFHGSYKPGVAIGVGVGDLSVPDEFLDGLRLLRARV